MSLCDMFVNFIIFLFSIVLVRLIRYVGLFVLIWVYTSFPAQGWLLRGEKDNYERN